MDIKQNMKSPNAILCVTVMMIFCVIFTAALKLSSDGEKFTPSPSHMVLNKWYDENNRKYSINKLDITEEKTFYLTLDKKPFKNAKIILKSENMLIRAYTDGKMLYKSRGSGFGEYISIIDTEDVNKNSEIYIHLTPVSNMTGRIKSDIYLTSNNDYLLTTICKNKENLCICLALAAVVAFLFAIGAVRLAHKNKKAPKSLYFSCFLMLILTLIFFKGDISQFLIGSSDIKYICIYASYMLLAIPLSAFLSSVLGAKHKCLYVLEGVTLLYSSFRLLLFALLTVPLSRMIIISHLLLICSAALPIIIFILNKTEKND